MVRPVEGVDGALVAHQGGQMSRLGSRRRACIDDFTYVGQ